MKTRIAAGVVAGLVALMLAQPGQAQEAATGADAVCAGRNLIETLHDEARAKLDAAVEGVPYAQGILWRAERGAARLYLVGTYHFDDPRHAQTLAAVGTTLADAQALLVEAGPEEEAQLQAALTRDPSLIVDAEGPTLRARLSDAEWQALSVAMADRGIAGVITAQLRPWYVSVMLSLSPCMIAQARSGAGEGGLDARMIAAAEAAKVPVIALEPWDTMFTLFAELPPEQELDMIRVAVPGASLADDYAVTLADAYFAGDVWILWEFGRLESHALSDLDAATIDAQIDLARERLMDARNRDWIAPLTRAAEDAAGQGGHVVAAFGALHLPGEAGVLRLLEQDGWTISVWE
ncbi:MAG: TraB/GumN family protein [Paracoccus sp. (in: a-proteobacteria)]|nr:TraB/GumN family protein [Paracoccus sp. (in: a-proteobacteria)]